MHILIVSATKAEIEPAIRLLGAGISVETGLTRFVQGMNTVDILITGVGMVATAFRLGQVLKQYRYDLSINCGICGSYNRSYRIGEVVRVVEDCFPEMGAETNDHFIPLPDLNLSNPEEPPFRQGKLKSNFGRSLSVLAELPMVKAATVNTVHGNTESITRFRSYIDSDIETMEGAAFHYAALLENVPDLQLRAVSNYVEQRDTSTWNIPLAISNLNKTLLLILEEFSQESNA